MKIKKVEKILVVDDAGKEYEVLPISTARYASRENGELAGIGIYLGHPLQDDFEHVILKDEYGAQVLVKVRA